MNDFGGEAVGTHVTAHYLLQSIILRDSQIFYPTNIPAELHQNVICVCVRAHMCACVRVCVLERWPAWKK